MQHRIYLNTNLRKCRDDGEIRRKHYLQGRRSRSEPAYHKLEGYKFNKPHEPINGFYRIIISNYAYYEGLFKNGQRFGPGVLTYVKSMCQNVGWWKADQILRLCRIVESQWVPSIKYHIENNFSEDSFTHGTGDRMSKNVEEVIKIISTGINIFPHDAKALVRNTPEILDCKLELEKLLRSESSNILVKRCNISENEYDDLAMYEEFQNWAYTETMEDVLEYSLTNVNQEITFRISHLITNQRREFGLCGPNERACRDFLLSCSNGDEISAKTLRDTYNINPDMCDGNGNTGLLYASARDRLNIITYLFQLEANFNISNDDGFTPLGLVLCRFIALLRNIKNWNSAFVYNASSEFANEVFTNDTTLLSYEDINFFYNNKSISIDSPLERNLSDIPMLFNFYGLHLPGPSLQRFQEAYTNNGIHDSSDKFIFNFQLLKPAAPTKKISRSKARQISNETFMQLTVIFNTILVLLHYGSNPLLGTIPMPPLFLGLFTENTDVIRILMKFGADPLARLPSYHNITVLHGLVSMRSGYYLVDMCKVLLSVKFDLDARTDGNHWWEERSWVVGSTKDVLDTGKTALHILALRKDFLSDPWQKQLVELLITNGASPSKRYLGHVPLTIAMLRGNIDMVKILLKNGACANEPLGGKMGVPLNLFLLNRFKDQLPSYISCSNILELLLEYGGDPLQKVSSVNNIFEFLIVDQSQNRTMRVSAKRFNIKRISKPIPWTEAQNQIRMFLLNNARKRLSRHYECLMFMALFLALKKGIKTLSDVGFHLKLVQLMQLEHSLQIARYFMFLKILNPKLESDYKTLFNMLSFIKKYGAQTQLKTKKALITAINQLTPLTPNGNIPELDLDFRKYHVCFTCCLHHGKILLTCPSCGLVNFCSRRCEMQSKRAKRHPCKITFYSDELLQYKFCINHNIHYESIHDEFFNNIRKILLNINHKV